MGDRLSRTAGRRQKEKVRGAKKTTGFAIGERCGLGISAWKKYDQGKNDFHEKSGLFTDESECV